MNTTPGPEQDMDLKLMSAAPDLLKALYAAIEFADIIEPYTEEEAEFLAMAEAAIAKARGDSLA